MSNRIGNPIWLLIYLYAVLVVSCTAPDTDTSPEIMIEPGHKIGETVIRRVADERETQPALWTFCSMQLAELSSEKTEDCVVEAQPSLFLGNGMMESDPEALNSSWETMVWEIFINGQPVELDSFGTLDVLGGRFWNIVIDNPTSDPLQIVTIVTIDEDPPEQYGMMLNLSAAQPDVAELARQADSSLPPISSGTKTGQHAYYSKSAQLDYLLYVPVESEAGPQQAWPLIVFLHGAIPRSRIDAIKEFSLPKLLEEGQELPFLILSPRVQGEYEFWAEDETIDALNTLLEEIQTNLSVDPQRIYLTGDSAGGNGTWEIGLRYPDRFAALVPVMGYYGYPFTVPDNICDLTGVPVWAFHGANDEIVPLAAEQQLIDALQACGGDVQFTIYPDGAHDIEDAVFDTQELFTWLAAQRSGR